MDNNIIDYIKSEFPKVIFNPINLNTKDSNFSKALGFVISDNKLILGYISKNGSLCKLIEPIDIKKLNNESFTNLIKKIPVVIGLDKENKDSLINLLENTSSSSKNVDVENVKKNNQDILISELTNLVNKKDAEYKVLLNKCSEREDEVELDLSIYGNDLILIKKQYVDKIENIKKEYEITINKINDKRKVCKNKIINEKEYIINSIKNFKKNVSDFIKSKDLENDKDINDIKKMYQQILNEKIEIEKTLESIKLSNLQISNDAENKIKNVENESQLKSLEYTSEINKLTDSMNSIKKELEMYSKEKLELQMLNSHKDKCIEKILIDKSIILQKIKNYNKEWMDWVNSNEYDSEIFKNKLADETKKILSNLKTVIQHKNKYIQSLKIENNEKEELLKKLSSNANDIKLAVQIALSEQFIELSAKKERELALSQNTHDLITIQNNENDKDKDKEILELKNELSRVRAKLEQNNNTSIKKDINYTNCNEILQKYTSISNLFSRKSEILNILENIIYSKENKLSFFTNLNQNAKDSIKEKFESVKIEINSYIKFLNIKEYTDFSKKYVKNDVPIEFCEKLTSVLENWNQKISDYRNQDTVLTNLYEDLSGAVRVYIKEKPLFNEDGIKINNNTISFEIKENKKQKKLIISCPNEQKIFGEFFGIFDSSFSNLDAYTGIQNSEVLLNKENNFIVDLNNLIVDNTTVSPGLYNSFKQIEDGYSIVLFGYGASGSGKTFSLLGNNDNNGANKIPGVLHYGLANLQNVKNIELTNVFEHYFERFSPTGPTVTGKIINLIGKLPSEFDNYQKRTDERNLFNNILNSDSLSNVKLNDIRVKDLFSLTYEIDKYRKSKKRIKETPNNINSSRSHLYLVFKINFNNNTSGYVTVVDTAGRESVMEIGNMFLKLPNDTVLAKNKISTALGLSGGVNYIEKIKKLDIKKTNGESYSSRDILEILNEGLFINESINHLVYFFNKKNYKNTKIEMLKDFSNYTIDKYFVNPIDEEGDGGVSKINPRNNCLMIPIMKFLDRISNKNNIDTFTPTKFITLIALRSEESKCNQIFETLDFAENIKSS